MKNFVLTLFALVVGFLGYAQEKAPEHQQQKMAKMEFVQEEIDYGTIENGADGKRVFEFTNVGEAPLIITNVSTTCGCTTPFWTKEAIAPKAKGRIEVKYDTKRTGPFKKTITIYSNDGIQPQKSLRIKGVVLEPKN